jgi:hypothetical protein
VRNETITSTGSASLNATKNVLIFSDFHVASGGYLSVKIHPGGFYCTKEAPMTSEFSNETIVEPESFIAGQSLGKLLIYPNPTESSCRISYPTQTSASGTKTLAIVDKTGKILDEMVVTGGSETEINLDRYPAGIYLIKYSDGKMYLTGKVIKRE